MITINIVSIINYNKYVGSAMISAKRKKRIRESWGKII